VPPPPRREALAGGVRIVHGRICPNGSIKEPCAMLAILLVLECLGNGHRGTSMFDGFGQARGALWEGTRSGAWGEGSGDYTVSCVFLT
jgi:hypothetical protein